MGRAWRSVVWGWALYACNPATVAPATDCDNPADPACAPAAAPICSDDEALHLFRRRIEPLVKDERPSSCNRCHLTELDLSLFLRGSPCRSMACLHEKGLVDFESPDESQILGWIRRGDVGGGDEAGLAAQQEYAAFREWITYSARCHETTCEPVVDPCGDRARPDGAAPDATRPDARVPTPVVRDAAAPDARAADAQAADARAADAAGDAAVDARASDARVADASARDAEAAPDARAPDAVVADAAADAGPIDPCSEGALVTLFQERIFRWRNRCVHCHSPEGMTAGVGGAPLWLAEGEDRAAAAQTMRNVIERGLVDTAKPEQSLLVLKPLNQRDAGIRHGGGTKFPSVEDEAYLDFRAWIDQYAACNPPPPDGGRPDGAAP